MSVARLARVQSRLVAGDAGGEVEEVLSLDHLVLEPPHEGGLGIGVSSAEDLVRDSVLHHSDSVMGDAELVRRILYSEVSGGADAGTNPIGAGLTSKVGIILTATQSPPGPVRQVPGQHRFN